jgi:hypothetical protein
MSSQIFHYSLRIPLNSATDAMTFSASVGASNVCLLAISDIQELPQKQPIAEFID